MSWSEVEVEPIVSHYYWNLEVQDIEHYISQCRMIMEAKLHQQLRLQQQLLLCSMYNYKGGRDFLLQRRNLGIRLFLSHLWFFLHQWRV